MIKAHQASFSAHAELEAQQVLQAKADARARVLRDFERGLTFNIGGGRSTNGATHEVGSAIEDTDKGTKRKFQFDEGAVERLAKEAEDAAMRTIEAEQVGLEAR
jgi:nitric oxide synthase-interacting protein